MRVVLEVADPARHEVDRGRREERQPGCLIDDAPLDLPPEVVRGLRILELPLERPVDLGAEGVAALVGVRVIDARRLQSRTTAPTP